MPLPLSKEQITYDILKGQGMLYEIAHNAGRTEGQRLYGKMLELFAMNSDIKSNCWESPSEMAIEYLEFFYNGAERPSWLRE